MSYNLIGVGNDAKTTKGNGDQYMTAIMYLTPWKSAGINTCPMAEQAACKDACLNTAGRGQMDSVQEGRARKTRWYASDREGFMTQLVADLVVFTRRQHRNGIQPVVRLNGTSDIRWELVPVVRDGIAFPHVFAAFPEVQFYDYTKIPNRKVGDIPNYHLTFSYSGSNPAYAKHVQTAIANGLNIAVVFRTKRLPETFLGLPVHCGDNDDLRFLDPRQCVVGLYAKGDAKHDTTGFVVDVQ